MKEIGGFFELELKKGKEYHEKALSLNSARNCLRHIIQIKGIKNLLVPYYICEAVIDALQSEAVNIIFYHIDGNFTPILQENQNDYLLYINYFGVNARNIVELQKIRPKLIIDNAQAFYNLPLANIDTFYSPRKFFGVPDGGYLYCPEKFLGEDMETAVSYDRFEHLLNRIDLTARVAYPAYKKAEKAIADAPVRKMSNLTKALLSSIDYAEARARRLENFAYLHHALSDINELSLNPGSDDVPLVYPFLTKYPDLRQNLINHSIYVATYWPDLSKRIPAGSWEAYLVSNLLPLPIDQRYSKEEMDIIIALLMDNLSL